MCALKSNHGKWTKQDKQTNKQQKRHTYQLKWTEWANMMRLKTNNPLKRHERMNMHGWNEWNEWSGCHIGSRICFYKSTYLSNHSPTLPLFLAVCVCVCLRYKKRAIGMRIANSSPPIIVVNLWLWILTQLITLLVDVFFSFTNMKSGFLTFDTLCRSNNKYSRRAFGFCDAIISSLFF